MVFMNFWYIEHYGASFGDDFDDRMNDSILSNVFMNFWYIKHNCARVGDDFVAKKNYFKHIKWYSMYIDYKQKN